MTDFPTRDVGIASFLEMGMGPRSLCLRPDQPEACLRKVSCPGSRFVVPHLPIIGQNCGISLAAFLQSDAQTEVWATPACLPAPAGATGVGRSMEGFLWLVNYTTRSRQLPLSSGAPRPASAPKMCKIISSLKLFFPFQFVVVVCFKKKVLLVTKPSFNLSEHH